MNTKPSKKIDPNKLKKMIALVLLAISVLLIILSRPFSICDNVIVDLRESKVEQRDVNNNPLLGYKFHGSVMNETNRPFSNCVIYLEYSYRALDGETNYWKKERVRTSPVILIANGNAEFSGNTSFRWIYDSWSGGGRVVDVKSSILYIPSSAVFILAIIILCSIVFLLRNRKPKQGVKTILTPSSDNHSETVKRYLALTPAMPISKTYAQDNVAKWLNDANNYVKTVNTTKSPQEFFTSYKRMIDTFENLFHCEAWVNFNGEKPSSVLLRVKRDRQNETKLFIGRYTQDVRIQIYNLSTDAAKSNKVEAFYQTLTEFHEYINESNQAIIELEYKKMKESLKDSRSIPQIVHCEYCGATGTLGGDYRCSGCGANMRMP